MSARRDAIFALALWQSQGTFPSAALAGSQEYAFALELVNTTLRHKSTLEWMLKRCVKRLPTGELWAALLMGAAQLMVMPSVASYAAINETVEAVKPTGKRAAAFVNAALRNLQRQAEPLRQALAEQPEHLRRAVPAKLWQRWETRFGLDQTRQIAMAMAEPSHVMIRLLQGTTPPTSECQSHPEDPLRTFIVPRGVRVDTLPGFAEGTFVVQDVATATAVDYLDVHPGDRVWDTCAAPGGKTVQLAARLFASPNEHSQLVAMEKSPTRVPKLQDTLQRCGFASCVHVCTEDAVATTVQDQFNKILMDVPCSNTGVFGRRPDARWTWTPAKLEALVATQQAILESAAKHLAPGGIIVYSTCSLEWEEDEGQIELFLQRHPEFTCSAQHRHWPSALSDGAFAAKLERILR